MGAYTNISLHIQVYGFRIGCNTNYYTLGVMDFERALVIGLYLFLFGMAFYFARKAVRIGVKKDFRLITDLHGLPVPKPEQLASRFVVINAVAAAGIVLVLIAIPIFRLHLLLWKLPIAILAAFYGFAISIYTQKQRKKYPSPPHQFIHRAASDREFHSAATAVALICPNCKAMNRDVKTCFRCGAVLHHDA